MSKILKTYKRLTFFETGSKSLFRCSAKIDGYTIILDQVSNHNSIEDEEIKASWCEDIGFSPVGFTHVFTNNSNLTLFDITFKRVCSIKKSFRKFTLP